MYETTRVAPLVQDKVKLPSISVIVPFVVHFSTTLAPMIGSPDTSVTIPFISIAC